MNNKFWMVVLAGIITGASGCKSKMPDIPLVPAKSQAYEEVRLTKQSPEVIKKELEKLQLASQEVYHISGDDRFDFKVYDNEELNATGMVVTPDGYVSIGLIGPVKIGGMTVPQATAMIETKLKKFINYPKISLSPTSIQSSTFTISGKVNNPGIYPIRNHSRITDAIALAKGFATGEFQGDTVELADLGGAYVARKGKVLPVDFVKAIREGDWLNNIPLQNGDYIYIPSSMNSSIYILGEVYKPTYVGFKDNMTLIQAFAFAQGLKDTHSESALVIRGSLVNPKIYKINIDDVMRGKGFDFMLQPNDIVFVPRGGLSQYNLVVEKLLPTLEALNLLAGPFGNSVIGVNSSSDN
ncbi:MAG: polysaccharide biosynthesis/export family protein [Victivallaceae bacterium]